jgi:D-alanyl-D-alanine carboxypeptidase
MMPRFRHVASLAILLMGIAAGPIAILAPGKALPPRADAPPNTLEGRAAAVMYEALRCDDAPGMALSLRRQDGTVVDAAAGHADRRRTLPFDELRPAQIGSITKLFTAAVVLKLAEEGRLTLDEPLATWFPAYPGAARITVRQMMMHRSGLPEMLDTADARVAMAWPWRAPDPRKLAIDLASHSAKSPPGGAYDYSNTNYLLLGLIAEKVSGRSLATLYRDIIFSPLKIERAWLAGAEPAQGTPPMGYDHDLIAPFGLFPVTSDMIAFVALAHGAGGLMMPVAELHRAVDGILGGAILSRASLTEMERFGPAPHAGIPGQRGYGLGLAEYQLGDARWFGHAGVTIGFTSVVLWREDGRESLAMSCNRSSCDVWGAAMAVRDALDSRVALPGPCDQTANDCIGGAAC